METYFEFLATSLGLVLVLLLYLRGRRRAPRVSRERDLVEKSVDLVVSTSRFVDNFVAVVAVGVVVYLAFREALVAKILLVTLTVMAVIALVARLRSGGGA
jgi:hypothetical protein